MTRFLLLVLFFYSMRASAVLDWTEVQIPMSDGQSLAADYYLPEDWTSGPVILIQTPYNKNLVHLFGLPLGVGYAQETSPYAFVILDWRGRFGSIDAAYVGSPTTGEDGFDAVEWVASQTWCDGNIGTWGPSALGRVQYETARQHPPHLKCIAPLVAAPSYSYEEYYPGGSSRTEFIEQLDNLGFGMSTGIYAHPYVDFSWISVEQYYDYMDEIDIPVLMIAGWYDHNIDLMLPSFTQLQMESAASVQEEHRLLVGPWAHGGNGTASVGSATQGQLSYPEAENMNTESALQFFDYYLKGIQNGWLDSPAVKYFQMGENEWLSDDAWPPFSDDNVSLYFNINGELSAEIPATTDVLDLIYDPEDPSPTVGGPTLRNDLEQGPYDQAPSVESRNDILSFTTAPLSAPVQLKGQAHVQVTMRTDVADTDLAVRLCDVYPDGRSMLVCDGIFRLRFMNGFQETDEIALVPGQDYVVGIDLPNTAITFLAGHQIRVDITGSNYPRFNRNMNTGGDMYPDGNGDTLVSPLVAHDEIVLSTTSTNGSFITLPITGSFPESISEMVSVQLEVFPNPAKDQIRVQFTGDFSNEMIRISDLQGKIICDKTVNAKMTAIDVRQWPAGQYLLSTRKSGSIRFTVE